MASDLGGLAPLWTAQGRGDEAVGSQEVQQEKKARKLSQRRGRLSWVSKVKESRVGSSQQKDVCQGLEVWPAGRPLSILRNRMWLEAGPEGGWSR